MDSTHKFSCEVCQKVFSYRFNLKRHMKIHSNPELFCCEKCNKQFQYKSTYKRHISQATCAIKVSNLKKCPLCNMCDTYANILLHFSNSHEVEIVKETFVFQDVMSFESWKEKVEKETSAKFIKRQKRNLKSSLVRVYNCHRNGYETRKGLAKRLARVMGSNKINGFCPAEIKVKIDEKGAVQGDFLKTHVGHDCDVGRLTLTKSERLTLATKISSKVPFDSILNEVRSSVSHHNLQRIDLLTRKDLYNIEQEFQVSKDLVKHKNDATIVDCSVKESLESGEKIIRLYKPQGSVSHKFPNLSSSDDFLLITMTDAQRTMLEKFGNKTICIDWIDGTTGFELTTLMVLDDLQMGFPCAYMFSNKNDADAMEIFFKTLKECCPNIQKPTIFMSDMAEFYYNAWARVMPEVDERLYCCWHVDRAWRRNLNKIPNKEKRAQVYESLRTLLEDSDIQSFLNMLGEFIEYLNNDHETAAFGEYFQQNYCGDVAKQWAYCYRLDAGVDTNKNLERMHKTLKYTYMKGKTNKSLDKAIKVILNLSRGKTFQKVIMKEKLPNQLSPLRFRHKDSLELINRTIIFDKEKWLVPSTDGKEYHTVSPANIGCTCGIVCIECECCIHAYACTCPDSSIKSNMCKHIHLVRSMAYTENISEESNVSPALPLQIVENEKEIEEQLLTSVHKTKAVGSEDVETRKTKLIKELSAVISSITTSEEIEDAEKYLDVNGLKVLINNLKNSPSSSKQLKTTKRKNIQPQRTKQKSTKKLKVMMD